jgi:hypothetical protein
MLDIIPIVEYIIFIAAPYSLTQFSIIPWDRNLIWDQIPGWNRMK